MAPPTKSQIEDNIKLMTGLVALVAGINGYNCWTYLTPDGNITTFNLVKSIFSLIVIVFSLTLIYGLYTKKKWVRSTMAGFSTLVILSAIATFEFSILDQISNNNIPFIKFLPSILRILSIAISIFFIWYMNTIYVRHFFDPAVKIEKPKKTEKKIIADFDTATILSRFFAAFIDSIAAIAIFILIVNFWPDDTVYKFAWSIIFAIMIIAILQLLFIIRRSQSIGKNFMNIQVVHFETGKRANIFRYIFLRGFVGKYALSLVIPIYDIVDALSIFLQKDRRTIHDFIAATRVVNLNKEQKSKALFDLKTLPK
ncbi:MAG: RDD family protein [bacterium]